jgi:hypothetical protein
MFIASSKLCLISVLSIKCEKYLCWLTWGSIVSAVARLHAWWLRNHSIPIRAREFCVLHNLHVGLGNCPAFYSTDAGQCLFLRGKSWTESRSFPLLRFPPPYQQSEYKVFYELMCWLSESLTCRLPNVRRSAPARRSREFNHCWLIFWLLVDEVSTLSLNLLITQTMVTTGILPLQGKFPW